MPTSFEYIESVMDRAVEAGMNSTKVSAKEKQEANEKSRKLIAGFRIQDEAAEKAHLDALVEKRRGLVKKFIDDRKVVREKLKARGITPLAVCPTSSWEEICIRAGLFILEPDSKNRVSYDHARIFKEYNSKNIEREAQRHWGAFLKNMFPTQKASLTNQYYGVTIQLPDPPADVAKTLVRAQGLRMRTAAVAEAISFVQTPSQILAAASVSEKDLWARSQGYKDYADWVRRDPIVFHDHGTATAIIAQFGDFPIEKEVVDAVVGMDTLISDNVEVEVAMQSVGLGTAIGSYTQYGVAQQLLGSIQTTLITPAPQQQLWVNPVTINSTTWTGR